MKLVIVSDSHGNKELQRIFLNQLSEHKPDMVIHLGDYYEDAYAITEAGYPLIRIPGTWTSYYQDSMIDNRRYESFLGWTFFLTHTPTVDYHDLPEDEDPEDVIFQQKCDVLFHGHTHHPRIEKVGNVWVINPGHTKSKFDRGYPPSYAIVTVSSVIVKCSIIELLTGDMLLEKEIKKL